MEQCKQKKRQIKIAFYMDNKNFNGRNLNNVEAGNPGIGGSHYMQLLTAQCLAEEFEDLEVIMYVTKEQCFPDKIKINVVENLEDALKCMKHDKCRVFVLSNWYNDLGNGIEILRLIEEYKIRTIIWAHIFMNHEQYAFIAQCKYIRLFVCLGKQQLEMLRGAKLYKKATYINYVLPPAHTLRQIHDRKIVVYVGAIYPYKGFHILAKYWKYIKKSVSDAELWVVGSAKLYGDHVSLGKYGIAESKYERQFISYLLDSRGKIDSSVKFMGSLGGKEKEKVVSQATVGVFNPTGTSETFGLSGVEFEAMGIPVVSIYRNSSPDIIKDKVSGLLYKDESDFPQYIIRLLRDSTYNRQLGEQARIFVNKEFEREKILKEWYDVLVRIAQDEPLILKHDKHIMLDNQIWLHHIENVLRDNAHIEKFIWDSKIVTGY